MATKSELLILIAKAIQELDDADAVKFKLAYPKWNEGIEITQDMINAGKNRFQCDDVLYRTDTPHTTQANWKPGIETASIWTAINVSNAGTLEDPIPAVAGMEYVYGKYYIEGETVYICKRTGEADGGVIVLQFLPSLLIGQYFEVA